MSYLEELLGKAEVFHAGSTKRDQTKSNNAVVFDAFDDMVYNDLVEEVPAFSEMTQDLDYKYDYAQPLCRDVLQFFWQSDPLVRKREEMAPDYYRNHAVADDIANSPETQSTRGFTKHDRYNACMATIAISDKVKDLLDNYHEESVELEQMASGISVAGDQLGDALDGLAQAMEAMQAAMDDHPMVDEDGQDIEGPMTQEQAAAAEALEQALAAAQEAREALITSEQEAEEAAESFARMIRADLRQALDASNEAMANDQEMFSSWGLEPGELQRLDWKTRAALAARMNQKALAEMRDRVGRFVMSSRGQVTKKYHFGRDEVIGTELSNDPERILASEWAMGRHPKLRMEFLQRLAESAVLSRKYVGVEIVGKGPIILLCDGSGSMKGARNIFCKGFGLGLLEQAKAAKRDMFIINFATEKEIITYDFPKGLGPIERVLDFAEHFWNGAGTNFMAPLDLAQKVMQERFNSDQKGKADICFVTDGEADVTVPWKENWDEAKKRLDFRVFGIMCGSGVSQTMKSLCDNTRSVGDFVSPDAVEDIFRAI